MRLFRGGAAPDPAAAEALLGEAEELLDAADPEGALRLSAEALRLLRGGDDQHAWLRAALLSANAAALNDLERFDEAASAAAEAAAIDPDDPAAWQERALADYRRARFADAAEHHRAVLRLEPEEAASWHGLGRALLWLGDEAAARDALAHAAALDPAHHVRPVRIAGAEFDRIAAQAWRSIPASFRARLQNTLVVAEALPDAGDVAAGFDPDTLGIYEGATALHESFPERIVLFQRNHELVCANLGALREEVRRTMLHEVGHHFGMEEGELPW